MHKGSILVVEDDKNIGVLIKTNLEGLGYFVRLVKGISDARSALLKSVPGLIVLDRRLPDGDGIDLCREIRSKEKLKNVPVLFLTAMGDVPDRVSGLKVGGDDYISKPFSVDEFTARVESLFRRSGAQETEKARVLKAGNVVLDLDKHVCTAGGKKVDLWPKEFELLKVLIEKKGKVLTREFLSEYVWNHEHLTSSRNIDAAVQRLRKKLGKEKSLVETVKGYGIRLKVR